MLVTRSRQSRAAGFRPSSEERLRGHGTANAAKCAPAGAAQAGGWTTLRMVARDSERLTARRGAVARYYGRQ